MSFNVDDALASSQPGENPGRSRPLVLIVEDDPDNAHLITRFLTAATYDFLVTAVGRDALHHAVTTLPDAITLDLRLPDVDGYDLLAALTQHPDVREIPIIVISAFGDELDPRLAGAFAIVPKPIDRDLLRLTVEAAVQRTRPLSP